MAGNFGKVVSMPQPKVEFFMDISASSPFSSSVKLQVAGEGLAERPVGRHDVGEDQSLAVGNGDLEGQRLAVEVGVGLPVCAPVPGHRQPPGLGSLHGDGLDRPGAGNVTDQHQLEVVLPVDGEPDASMFLAGYSASITIVSLGNETESSMHGN